MPRREGQAAPLTGTVHGRVAAGATGLALAAIAWRALFRERGEEHVDRVPRLRPPGGLRVVALGTSLTALGGWRAILRERLAERLGRPVELLTVARTGATSRWGLEALHAALAREPDILLVEFAGNDAALHRPVSLRESRANLAFLAAAVRQRAPGTRLAIMAMSPARGLARRLRPRLNAFGDAHLTIARGSGALAIDLRGAWAALSVGERAAAIPDGLHPAGPRAATLTATGIADALTA